MPWRQYTRNFEDVILVRALQHVAGGFFLDVGACNPVADSNTYALYERGWRGIAVEPLGELAPAWAETRPGDVFVHAAAGAQPGERELHVFPDAAQISTLHAGYAGRWRSAGYGAVARRVPVVTLDRVLHEHGKDRPLHLVSIDVEGAEAEALGGLDLARHRPWLMVIEACEPGTPEPSHMNWEPAVLGAGYEMVYFDGVNRFYLSAEHPELREHFRLPPNVWDDFVVYRGK